MSKYYKTSKFVREYGLTLQQIADKYNMSTSYIRILHLQGELHQFVEAQGEKKKVGVDR